MARLTEDQLKAITDQEIRQCIGGISGGKLAESRRKAEQYYLGLAKGDLSPPEVDGRSTFVDTTVRNQIEWMVPSLMRTFCSGETVVEFTPSKAGDEAKAKNATDYINYLFYKKNPGYTVLQTAIRDALLQKAGIIKIWWDDRQEESREEYRGMTDVDLALLMDDDEVEPIEQKSYPDEEDVKQRKAALEHLQQQLEQAEQAAEHAPPAPAPQPGQPPQPPSPAAQAVTQLEQQIEQINKTPPKKLYDVSFKRTKKGGKICVEAVPPEEFLISRKAKRMDDGFMKGHRVMRTLSDLKAMGYKNVDDIQSDDSMAQYSSERIERMSWDDDQPYLSSDDTNLDPSMKLVWLTELYMQIDYDGDGIAEWRKIVRAGNQVLENEECDGPPFAALIPILMPHRFFGLSIADLGMEPQKLQTQLVRANLDNLFLAVNRRHWIVEGQVNLDDFLTSRPGGGVRVKAPGMIGELGGGIGAGAESMAMLNWVQDFTENATGWTRRSQGVGADGLQQQTATGMNIITNRDDMRLDLIARNFAEGGITDLFKMMLKLVCQYQNAKDIMAVSGSFVEIDPREWTNQFNLNINVGLGTNNKDQQAQHLMGLLQIQEKALQIGVATPENVYNAASLYAMALGQKSPDKFFTDPSTQPPPPQQPPKPDPAILKIQSDQQLQQNQLQADVQKHQAEQVSRGRELQLEAERDRSKIALEAQKAMQQAQLDMQERQYEAQLAAHAEAARLAFEQWKAQLENDTKVIVAQISASTKTEPAGSETNAALATAMQGFTAALQQLKQPKGGAAAGE
ncbi:MAG TPA: hypothetical protein VIE69_00355 [Methylophilaceae bacterium]